jgi:hypothetical protein
MLHPSLNTGEADKIKEGCNAGLVEFDRKHLKPFFVFEYTVEKQKKVDEFDEKFIRQREEKEEEIKDLIGNMLMKKLSKSAIV